MGFNTWYLAVAVVLLAMCSGPSGNAVAASIPAFFGDRQVLCPGVNEQDPEKAKFCTALKIFLEIYSAIDDRAPEYEAIARDYPQLFDTGVKRQDVVHSFLRFGRRR